MVVLAQLTFGFFRKAKLMRTDTASCALLRLHVFPSRYELPSWVSGTELFCSLLNFGSLAFYYFIYIVVVVF